MENNSISTLKNYISHVLMLEKTKYELEKSIENLKNHHFVQKKLPLKNTNSVGKDKSYVPFLIAIIAVVCLYFILTMPNVDNSAGTLASFLLLIVIFVGPIIIIGSVIAIFFTLSDNKQSAAQLRQTLAENKEIESQNAIYANSYALSNRLRNNAISNYTNALSSITNTLNKYYSENIIYNKYRNLTALTYIFEYLDSGRARTLVEAYNLFEQEVRLDIIISKLDVIINKLNTVIANQFEILQSVKENTKMVQETSKRLLEKANEISQSQRLMNSSLDSIKENTDIIKKTALIMEANQYYERNWNNMRGRYDQLVISNFR